MSREEQELAGFTEDESNEESLSFPTPFDEHDVEERRLEDESTIRVLDAQSTSELRKMAAYFVLSVYVAAVILPFPNVYGAVRVMLMLTDSRSITWTFSTTLPPISNSLPSISRT